MNRAQRRKQDEPMTYAQAKSRLVETLQFAKKCGMGQDGLVMNIQRSTSFTMTRNEIVHNLHRLTAHIKGQSAVRNAYGEG